MTAHCRSKQLVLACIVATALPCGGKEAEKSKVGSADVAAFYGSQVGRYRKSGQFQKALDACNQWIAHSSNGYPYFIRADIHHRGGNDEQALKDYGNAIKLEPKNFVYRDSRGRLLERLGRFKESFADYDYMVKKQNGDPKGQLGNRAVISYRMGNWKAAIQDLDKVLKDNPDPFLLFVRVNCYMQLNERDKALKDIDRFLLSKPKEVKFLVFRSQIMEEKGNLSQALIALDKAVKFSPFNPDLRVRRATLLKKMGRHAQAEQDLQESKKLKELEKLPTQ